MLLKRKTEIANCDEFEHLLVIIYSYFTKKPFLFILEFLFIFHSCFGKNACASSPSFIGVRISLINQ